MRLLFYSSQADGTQKRLEAEIRKVIPESKIELFQSLDDLRERLRMLIEPDSIAVLSASNRQEIRQLQSLRELLPEIYVVLVIPDRKKSTIELAHLLLPRFLSHRGSDFADLGKVVGKMYTNSESSDHGKSLPES